jgi:protein-L-isoaspartate(D-aspartate) O-methyltransferase
MRKNSVTPSNVVGRTIRTAAVLAPTLGMGMVSERVRQKMVDSVRASGVHDFRVLRALAQVPRHQFVDQAFASRAYEDNALPIGHAQTISKPSIVGRMVGLVSQHLSDDELSSARVLEVGTGCGYQAAILAAVFGHVFSIERIQALHVRARDNLRALRLTNLRLIYGDGKLGLPSEPPFDAIIIAAAGLEIPDALLLQMKVGGRLIAPVGADEQALHSVERVAIDDWRLTRLDAARFVPLVSGTAGGRKTA